MGAPIELAFDRLLLQTSITRQTFQLSDTSTPPHFLQPTPAYDPVSRVVRLCVGGLEVDQFYRITIASPVDGGDPNGLRAIDGALLDPTQSNVIEFQVTSGGPYSGFDACVAPTAVNFCNDVLPIFAHNCGGGNCHSGSLPAAGLVMNTEAGMRATALNRVAQGANTGSVAANDSLTRGGRPIFGVDMPIIDAINAQAGGAPGNSWLVYKLLLAAPGVCAGSSCDAGAGGHTQQLAVSWNVLSAPEQATLSDFISGREMPFPQVPTPPSQGPSISPLTADDMETVSLWILQGASVPDCTQ
jgi:hypothetical protein